MTSRRRSYCRTKQRFGVIILSRLTELGIEPSDIETCAAAGHILSVDGVDIVAFARAALALEEARKQTGLSIEELEERVGELEKRAKELEPLEEQANEVKIEIAELISHCDSLSEEAAQLEGKCQQLKEALKWTEQREAELSGRVMELEKRAHAADQKLTAAREDLEMLAAIGMSLEGLRGFVQRICGIANRHSISCLLYTSPSPRDRS